MTNKPIFPIDYNKLRIALVRELKRVTLLDDDHILTEEPEVQNSPRPTRPYMSFKITGPATKYGDDSYDNVSGTSWNTGGVRKMTVTFHAYGCDHEEAYNYMSLWQTCLNTESTLSKLRSAGLAVWMVGNVADLSLLLNTGYEGRSMMESTFGVAANLVTDYGQIEHVTVNGTLDEDINLVIEE